MTELRANGLIDALDVLVDAGTAVSGGAVIQLAGVDLIRLELRLVLAGVEDDVGEAEAERGSTAAAPAAGGAAPDRARPRVEHGGTRAGQGGAAAAESLEDGLGRLVLAVVELVRQLLERQAVRRMRHDTLEGGQVERLGSALRTLEERTAELGDALGVSRPELDRALGDIENLISTRSER